MAGQSGNRCKSTKADLVRSEMQVDCIVRIPLTDVIEYVATIIDLVVHCRQFSGCNFSIFSLFDVVKSSAGGDVASDPGSERRFLTCRDQWSIGG